jgi:hypothetical protein
MAMYISFFLNAHQHINSMKASSAAATTTTQTAPAAPDPIFILRGGHVDDITCLVFGSAPDTKDFLLSGYDRPKSIATAATLATDTEDMRATCLIDRLD